MPSDEDNLDQNLYEILEVPSTATQKEIKESYRRLCRQYHPDLNPSPDATTRMQQINAAYDILGNPTKRATYDQGLRLEEVYGEGMKREDPISYAASFVQQVRCQGCGKFNNTLRIVAFPYILSFLVVSFKRGESGIFCRDCRAKKSRKYLIISLLFGWWGIPFGVIWTIGALIANLRGGQMPKEDNQSLLAQLAWVSAVLGRIDEAKAALRDLLKYGSDEKAKNFKDELDRTYPTVSPAGTGSLGRRFRLGLVAIMVAVLGMYTLIGHHIFSEPSQTNAPENLGPSQHTSLTPPTNSFVVFDDLSNWTSPTTAIITGTVTNTHSEWSIKNVEIEVEELNEHENTLQKHIVPVSPDIISPGEKGQYYQTISVSSSCEYIRPALVWQWVPP